MGIMDAFSKEDRLEITVAQLEAILDDRARVEAENRIILKMCRQGLTSREILKIITDQEENSND